MNGYLQQPPHRQILKGLLAVVLFCLGAPLSLFLMMIVLAGMSLGTANLDNSVFVGWIVGLIGVVIAVLGVIIPSIRMAIISHRHSKQFGRGDEHIIFYIGASILTAWGLYVGLVGYPNNPTAQSIVLMYSAGLFGVSLTGLGLFLLYRLSKRVYDSMHTA